MIFDFEGEIDGFAAQVGTGSFDPSNLSQTASFEEPIDTSSRFKEQRLPDGIRPR
jgi:hypothetical protein